jgi:hypothetical protein
VPLNLSDFCAGTAFSPSLVNDPMKNNLVLSILLLISYTGQSQTWNWAVAEPKPSSRTATNIIVTDNDDNVVIGGKKSNSSGLSNMYIIRYNSSGNKLWEVTNSSYGYTQSLCTDDQGNVYATFFAASFEGQTFVSSNGNLLAKWDNNGNLVWWKHTGLGMLLSKDLLNGQLVVTGGLLDTVNLAPGITLTPGGNNKRFIAKFTRDGDCTWAISQDGGSQPLIINSHGEMLAQAVIHDSVTVGQGSDQVHLYAEHSCYHAKYDSLGNLKAVVVLPTTLSTIDNFGNFYLLDYDRSEDAGHSDQQLFLLKYDGNGNLLWNRTRLYSDEWYKVSIKCDPSGNVLIAGGMNDQLQIDSLSWYDHVNTRGFITQVDSAGTFQWVSITNGSGGCGVKDLCLGVDNGIYMVGDIGGGENSFGPHLLNMPAGVFVAKLLGQNTTETPESENEDLLYVYPNPSSGQFELLYKHAGSGEITVNVRNITGQLLLFRNYQTNQILKDHIDLSSQPKGLYFIELIADGVSSVKRIVVQ